MGDLYILGDDDRTPAEQLCITGWGRWMAANKDKKRVAYTVIGDAQVSTVFLGIDHGYGPGPPVLFETMVFHDEGRLDGEMTRCSTWEQAEEQHEAMCAAVREGPDDSTHDVECNGYYVPEEV